MRAQFGRDPASDIAPPQPRPTIAIIGAGFSGTMAAIHLRRALPGHVIYLIERTGRFARGVAYAASSAPHLLNVPATNMSALPDEPDHFARWLAEQAPHWAHEAAVSDAGTFATRRLYGRYLRALLYQERRASAGRLRLGTQDVVEATQVPDGWRLRCASGHAFTVAGLVVAVGNLPSRQPGGPVVYHNPWSPAATASLRPDEPVLVVGTGLTMVDLVLGMRAAGFTGPAIAISRRGLVPQPQTAPGEGWPCPQFSAAERGSALRLLCRLRQEIRQAEAAGVGWRCVVDSLRPVTASLWQALPRAEQSRFLRHLRPFWDSHRHRLPPSSAQACDDLRNAGALVVQRGRLHTVRVDGDRAHVTWRARHARVPQALEVQRVIYATGTGKGAADGLVANLIDQGLARADEQALGLDVSPGLQMLGADGGITGRAWALGPIVHGVFWECTSVPDIRVQARTIAQEVASQLAAARA